MVLCDNVMKYYFRSLFTAAMGAPNDNITQENNNEEIFENHNVISLNGNKYFENDNKVRF